MNSQKEKNKQVIDCPKRIFIISTIIFLTAIIIDYALSFKQISTIIFSYLVFLFVFVIAITVKEYNKSKKEILELKVQTLVLEKQIKETYETATLFRLAANALKKSNQEFLKDIESRKIY